MRRLTFLAAVIAATPAFANDIEGAVSELFSILATHGQIIDDAHCGDAMCDGFVGSHQIQMMWPDNGWVSVDYYPFYDTDFETNAIFCGSVIQYLTGADAETAGGVAGVLMGTAENAGRATDEFMGASLSATRTESGNYECAGKRPAPL